MKSNMFKAVAVLAGLALLTACASTDSELPTRLAEDYGPLTDGDITLPAVPAEYLETPNRRAEVSYNGTEEAGTIVVDPYAKFLYFVEEDGQATRYPVAVGRELGSEPADAADVARPRGERVGDVGREGAHPGGCQGGEQDQRTPSGERVDGAARQRGHEDHHDLEARHRRQGRGTRSAMVTRPGVVAEWLRQGPAKPCTRVRFPASPRTTVQSLPPSPPVRVATWQVR